MNILCLAFKPLFQAGIVLDIRVSGLEADVLSCSLGWEPQEDITELLAKREAVRMLMPWEQCSHLDITQPSSLSAQPREHLDGHQLITSSPARDAPALVPHR